MNHHSVVFVVSGYLFLASAAIMVFAFFSYEKDGEGRKLVRRQKVDFSPTSWFALSVFGFVIGASVLLAAIGFVGNGGTTVALVALGLWATMCLYGMYFFVHMLVGILRDYFGAPVGGTSTSSGGGALAGGVKADTFARVLAAALSLGLACLTVLLGAVVYGCYYALRFLPLGG